MNVLLLGTPLIQLKQGLEEGLRRKNRALIFYLAAHTDPVTRDQILAMFWPDTPRPMAQQTLRTVLHDLHKRLGDGFLLVEDERLSLNTKVDVDVKKFQFALKQPSLDVPALTAALKLYRGDFLDGFTLPDTPSFDDWAVTEREHYRMLTIQGYTSLSRLYESQRDHLAALEALNQALTFDPLQEDLQREALRLHYLSGDRAGAVRRYETLCKLLSEEMGIPPMPETRAVYDAIISDTNPGLLSPIDLQVPSAALSQHPSPVESITPFQGRTLELKKLQELSLSGKMILVEGAPGIGKTRLVNEFLAANQKSSRAEGRSLLVLRGIAHESEQGLPYQPVVDAIRNLPRYSDWPTIRANLDIAPVWLGEILRLVPDLQAQMPDVPLSPTSTDEARLWQSIYQFLQNLSLRRQVVLFLDDLHWADASTLGLIGYLARRLASSALLLIGTARPVENHSRPGMLWKDLSYEGHLAVVSLSPLSEADSLAIVGTVSPTSPDPFSRWVLENADGNPYFLAELLRHAYSTNLLHPDGTVDMETFATSQTLPPTIQNLILSRLIRLSEEARRVLDVAAVIGREFDFDLLYRSITMGGTSLSEGVVLDALDELQTAVMIQPRTSEQYSFDHSLTMEVVLQDMSQARQKRLHRQVALAMEELNPESSGAAAGFIARHYTRSNTPERAAPYAFQAGKYAAGLAAWGEAIAFYEQALSIELDIYRRLEIFLALGDARFHKGDFPQATATFREAIEQARMASDKVHLEEAYLELTKSLLPQSRYTEAIALGRDLAKTGPSELAACAHFIWGAALSVESAHPVEAEAHIREAQRLLEQQPDYSGPITLILLQYQLAAIAGQQGRSAEAVALYRAALASVQENEAALDLLRRIMLYNNLAYHLYLLGDPSAAEFAQAGMKLAKESGSLTHLSSLYSTSGEIALGQGDLDTAEEYFSEGLRLARQVPVPERIAGLTANLGLVARARGEMDLARQLFKQALSLAEQLGVLHLAVRIRIWLAPLLSQEEAHQQLQRARDVAEKSGFLQLLEQITSLEKHTFPT